MRKWVLLALAIVIMSPIKSYAYSWVFDGDQPQHYGNEKIWEANSGQLWLESNGEDDQPFKMEGSFSARFMIKSDYDRPSHKTSVYYGTLQMIDITVDYVYGSIGYSNIYAGVGLGSSLGTSDILLYEADTYSWNDDFGYINLLTDTWYYIWGKGEVELCNVIGGGKAVARLGFVLDSESAPTPIPGAVWLLGSGLVGLVGIRRTMKT